MGRQAALLADPVDPTGVGPAGRGAAVGDLGLVQQFQDEALVGGAALDDDAGLGHGAPQPGQGLVPVAAVGDDLGDHRVEVRGDRVALADAGVDAYPRPGRQDQAGDAAGRGREVSVRVLGVQPCLDGVPGLGLPVPDEAPAGRHVQLHPHQVDARGQFGDGVLDLQARVHLEERELLVIRVIEELHGRGAPITDREGEPLRGRLQVRDLLRGQQRGGGLLDDLLVAALHRAVPHAQRPGRALPVCDDLDLDVPRTGHEPFEEDRAVAERPHRLGTGPLEGLGEVLSPFSISG